MDLFLTEACTLQCDYCFVAGKVASRRMSWEVARASVDFLLEHAADRRELTVVFFGGEPLLEFPLMKRIAQYAERLAAAHNKEVAYRVTTNGTRMSREIAIFGQEHGFNYLLSVDGDRRAHDLHRATRRGRGSWDLVMGPNFDLLRSVQHWMGARITVNPDTVARLSAGVRLLYARGVNQFLIAPNMDVEWTAQQMDTLTAETREVAHFYAAERAKGAPLRIDHLDTGPDVLRALLRGVWGCEAGRSRVAVSCAGDLYPCSRFVSPFPGMKHPFRLGSVFEGITNLEARAELLDPAEDRRPACKTCGYRDVCSGGCPAVSSHMMGDIHLPAPVDCLTSRLRADLAEEIGAPRSDTVGTPA